MVRPTLRPTLSQIALGSEKFQLELQNRFALLETMGNVDEKTDTVVKTLQDVSRKLFAGKRGNRESKLSPETLEFMKKRRETQDAQMSSSDRRSLNLKIRKLTRRDLRRYSTRNIEA
ncbi:hypothetical protein ACJJTC_015182, partial [Scirpophaga incertulas]